MAEYAHTATKYLGTYEHGVDEKRRLQIPAKWRPPADQTGYELVLLLWQAGSPPAPCLLALPPSAFKILWDRVSALPFEDPDAEALRRSITADADVVTLDNAGRICLSQALADKAGITRQAVLVGMLDRYQIFSPENFRPVANSDADRRKEAVKLKLI